MSKVILVPGIRNRKPEDHFGDLRNLLKNENIKSEYADYGYILLPVTNSKAKSTIKEVAEPDDILVGYSNGGLASLEMAEEVGVKHLVLVSPAVRCDYKIPNSIESVTIFYSPGDWAVRLGKVYSVGVSLMPWRWGTPHGFGRMGSDGPCQEDSRIKICKMHDRINHSWYTYEDQVKAVQREVVNSYNRGIGNV